MRPSESMRLPAALLALAAAACGAPSQVRFRVEAVPQGTVYFDDAPVGQTGVGKAPVEVDADFRRVSSHTLRVENEGCDPQAIVVTPESAPHVLFVLPEARAKDLLRVLEEIRAGLRTDSLEQTLARLQSTLDRLRPALERESPR